MENASALAPPLGEMGEGRPLWNWSFVDDGGLAICAGLELLIGSLLGAGVRAASGVWRGCFRAGVAMGDEPLVAGVPESAEGCFLKKPSNVFWLF